MKKDLGVETLMSFRKSWRLLRVAGLLTLTAIAPAAAQNWPSAPIKFIVPVGPGLATDLTARLLADHMSQTLGASVVVENITGGSGVLGAQTVARAAPDGATIFFSNSSALTSNMYLLQNVKYDPVKDFSAVALVAASSPFEVLVNKDLPVHSIAELIAYGKAHPGDLSLGMDATSGSGLVAGRLLNKRGAIGATEVLYRATPQMIQDAISGRIQVFISAPLPVKGAVDNGQLRAIAISSKKRFPGLDNVPSVGETLPGFEVDGWFALMAPTGTPQPIVERLNAETATFLAKSEVREKLVPLGILLAQPTSVQGTADFIRGQQASWKQLASELDLKPQ